MRFTSKPYNVLIALCAIMVSCNSNQTKSDNQHQMTNTKTASQILGNPKYQAICYGGYRETSRDIQPTRQQLKEDMKILSAMGIKVLRTYNVKLPQASNLLKVIREMRKEDPEFEMYVMLGIWIDCQNAWTDIAPNHDQENEEANAAEVQRAVALAKQYPEIVKILAVGNEAMVKWAESYYVQAEVILKWVNYLQNLKKEGELDEKLWITSSDNFASWGGGDHKYHGENLEKLIRAVDFVSLHTYPMHNTHYHPMFWGTLESELHLKKRKAIKRIMRRAVLYAKKQYLNTSKFVRDIDSTKPIHIGETGWASMSEGLYGDSGSRACDEYKAGIYHKMMRSWTIKKGITCFYFEAFDERWKDAANPGGSENHFGLFKLNGEAKYALWDMADKGAFEGLARNGKKIKKTHKGNIDSLLAKVILPTTKHLR